MRVIRTRSKTRGTSEMWKHYRKTFVRMQIVIAIVTGIVFFVAQRQLPPAVLFFVVMQIGAIVGAIWAARLTALIQRRAEGLPLRHHL